MSQVDDILAVLSDHRPHRMEEIHQRAGFSRLNSRVSELRKRGHTITCEKKGGHYTYRLHETPSAVALPSQAAALSVPVQPHRSTSPVEDQEHESPAVAGSDAHARGEGGALDSSEGASVPAFRGRALFQGESGGRLPTRKGGGCAPSERQLNLFRDRAA